MTGIAGLASHAPVNEPSESASLPAETPNEPHAAPKPTALRQLAEALEGIPVPAAVASTVGMALLVLAHHHGSTSFFRRHFAARFAGDTFAEVYPYLWWFGAALVFYLLLPILTAALTPGIRVRETGVGLGDWRFGLTATVLMLATFLPVVYLASLTPQFANHYPLCRAAKNSWAAFLIYEAGYIAYFIAWEYFFRGYLLFSLSRSIGKLAAFATMMPFVIVHYGKPELETLGSIAAGIVLGLVALRARSFWYGAVVHIVVAVFMDVLAAWSTLTGGR